MRTKANGYCLRVEVENVRNAQGVVGVLVFNAAQGWPEKFSVALRAKARAAQGWWKSPCRICQRAMHAEGAGAEMRRTPRTAVFAWAVTDGSAISGNCPYTPPVGPEFWEPTPPAYAAAPLQPCWGQLRPFALTSGAACAPPPPPAYSEDLPSEFYANAFEVYHTNLTLTKAQQTIAQYWADGPGATGTPPGHWVAILGQMVKHDGLSLMAAAEGYARVGIAVADAFINCWSTKYTYTLLRPVTYIQRLIDAAWLPFMVTPPFPEYSSGHSTQSAAAAAVLTDMFGGRAFTDTTHRDHKLVPALKPRSFGSFEAAAEEAAMSRLYGGIHYPFGNNNGLMQGRCIGQAILDRVQFKR